MELLLGNCLDRLKELKDNSVDAIVTDPPYGLSFMGKKWDYDVPQVEVWKECLRVLKHGGYLLAFAGTRTQHRMAVNIEDAGFEIRDMIAWVYGSGFPKSLNIGKAVDKLQGNEREEYLAPIAKPDSDCWGTPNNNSTGEVKNPSSYNVKTENIAVKGGMRKHTKGTSQWEGWGTALKPAVESITVALKPFNEEKIFAPNLSPIIMSRKPLSEKSVAENCLKWGVGGINIDGCRVGYTDGTTEEQIRRKYTGSNEGNSSVTNNFGVKDIKMTSESTLTGRFPANLIHDGSDEVVGLFPQTKSGKLKSDCYEKGRENDSMFAGGGNFTHKGYEADSGSAARFFYCSKASKRERNIGCEGLEEKNNRKLMGNANNTAEKASKGFERFDTLPAKNNHPTVKPIALMEYLVKMVSREGQVVLDPFMGSGTTGMACKKLNRDFIGIEMMPEYMEIAKCRIEATKKEEQLSLV
jgi:DNA modification methylase